MFDGCDRVLQNVRYVPELRRNLISFGMLDSISCSIKIENEVMKVVKGALTLMKGVLLNGLCSLIGSTEYEIAASVVTKYKKDTTNKIVSANGENFTIEGKIVLTNGSNRTDLWHRGWGM